MLRPIPADIWGISVKSSDTFSLKRQGVDIITSIFTMPWEESTPICYVVEEDYKMLISPRMNETGA